MEQDAIKELDWRDGVEVRIVVELNCMIQALATLLVDKGIITRSEAEEKVEAVRPMVRRALGLE